MSLRAGAAEVDITPTDSQFLFGYPHVERYSTGVHDPLLASALILESGGSYAAFVTCDIIFVDKDLVASARARIAAATDLRAADVLISATHTHSGPHTVDHVSNEGDPIVPKASVAYRKRLEAGIVEAAVTAFGRLAPARASFAVADATGVGTNRRSVDGPADPDVPVLLVETPAGEPVAGMIVCSMHPTVLHEDSTLVSADFPGYARSFLKRHRLGSSTPVLYHTGPAGNQSPRHVTKANTFAEAERLGEIVGRGVVEALKLASPIGDEARIEVRSEAVELPTKRFPAPEVAEAALAAAAAKLARLRSDPTATKQAVRSAEVDWFGAEETVTLARAAAQGRTEAAARKRLPAEVMTVRIGAWAFVGLPGELFIEYSLEIRRRCPGAFVISLANGELQGYIVTAESAAEGGYEASNALFDHTAGDILTATARRLLGCA
jgi:neutral ceramidase